MTRTVSVLANTTAKTSYFKAPEMRKRMSNSLYKNTENRFDRLPKKKKKREGSRERKRSTYGSARTFSHKTNVGQESNM